jgi:hypothetical protein
VDRLRRVPLAARLLLLLSATVGLAAAVGGGWFTPLAAAPWLGAIAWLSLRKGDQGSLTGDEEAFPSGADEARRRLWAS